MAQYKSSKSNRFRKKIFFFFSSFAFEGAMRLLLPFKLDPSTIMEKGHGVEIFKYSLLKGCVIISCRKMFGQVL